MTAPRPCRKRRHLDRDAAESHAMRLARAQPGDRFHAYPCTACPSVGGSAVWHVGHPAKSGGRRTVWVDEAGQLHVPRLTARRP